MDCKRIYKTFITSNYIHIYGDTEISKYEVDLTRTKEWAEPCVNSAKYIYEYQKNNLLKVVLF